MGRFQALRWAAAAISAVKSDMTTALRRLEFILLTIGGFAGAILGMWTPLALEHGDFSPIYFLTGFALFEGGGFILVGICSFRWPAQKSNGQRIPRSRYAGKICIGVALCLLGMNRLVGVPSNEDVYVWMVVTAFIGAGLMLFSLLRGK